MIADIGNCLPHNLSPQNRTLLEELLSQAAQWRKLAQEQDYLTKAPGQRREPVPSLGQPTMDERHVHFEQLQSAKEVQITKVVRVEADDRRTVSTAKVSAGARTWPMVLERAAAPKTDRTADMPAADAKWPDRSGAAWRVAKELGWEVATVAVRRRLILNDQPASCLLRESVAGGPVTCRGKLVLPKPSHLPLRTDDVKAHATKLGFTDGKLSGDQLVLTYTGDTEYNTSDSRFTLTRLPILRKMNWADPALRRQLTQLQWWHTLIGQVEFGHGDWLAECDDDGNFRALWGARTENCFRSDVGSAPPWPPASGTGEREGKREVESEVLPLTSRDWQTAPPRVIDRADLIALKEYLRRPRDEVNALLKGLGPRDQQAHHQLRDHLLERLATLERDQNAVLTGESGWKTEETARRLGLVAIDEAMRDIDKLKPADGKSWQDQQREDVRKAFKAMHAQARATSYVAAEAAWQAEHEWCQLHWPDRENRVMVFDPRSFMNAMPQASSSSSSSSQTTKGPTRSCN